MGLKDGKVKLEKYNSNWEKMFLLEKEILENKFGEVGLSVEHIGSTSIKGLSAKPIIDMAVGVDKLSDFDKIKNNFINDKDYSMKAESTDGEVFITKGDENNRTHFIHVMEINGDRYIDSILFRDYLRNNEKDLKEYEALKDNLATCFSNNRKEYTKSKNSFIKKIINKAREDNSKNK